MREENSVDEKIVTIQCQEPHQQKEENQKEEKGQQQGKDEAMKEMIREDLI